MKSKKEKSYPLCAIPHVLRRTCGVDFMSDHERYINADLSGLSGSTVNYELADKPIRRPNAVIWLKDAIRRYQEARP